MGEFSDALLSGEPQAPVIPPTQQPQQGFADELLSPSGMPTASPLMEPTPEGERPPTVEFDFPDINQIDIPGLSVGQRFKAGGGLLFAMDEAQQIDIIRENIPDAEFDRDKFGNVFVTIPGASSPAYINRPGPSPQDLTQFGAMIAPGVGAGALGAKGGQALLGGLLGQAPARVAGVGAAEGLLSAGIDLGLQGVGSGQPVNIPRAVAAAGFGAAGETLLPSVARLLSGAKRRGVQIFEAQGGTVTLSQEARQTIEEAGLDPNTLSQEFVARLNQEVQGAAVPAQAQRIAEAETLPTPVPLTRGNITRQPNDQMFEDLAAKGAMGRTVQSVIQGTRDAQQEALRGSADQLQANLSGGAAQVLQRGEGGAIASQAINEIRDNASTLVNRAYDQARNAGQAGLPGDVIPGFTFNLGRAAADRLPNAPQTQAVLAELDQLGKDVGPDGAVLIGPLFDWRRRVTTLASDMAQTNPTEAGALRSIRNSFDAQITDIVEQGLLLGDDETVGLWLNAIAQRREFGQVFQAVNKDSPNYLVDLLTAKVPGGGNILRFEPDQAANAVFGVTNTGFVNKPQFARQIATLEQTLKEGGREDAWNAIREEAFARIMGQAEGPFIGSTNTRSFSGANLARAIDQAMERNRPAMMALFEPEELGLLAQLQRTALATTTVTAGGANTSNTSIAQSALFRNTLGKLFGKIFGPVLQSAADNVPLGNLPNLIRAQNATTAGLQRQLGLPAGVGGGVGAVAGPPAVEEFQRRRE